MDHTTRPEILAPAGTPDKLKTALHFGADAVYLGLKQFSMRHYAGNFDYDQLEWGIAYAHERMCKVYVAVNIQAFDGDLDGMEAALVKLGALAPDALIIADAGVLELARRCCPGLPLHLSTQANVTNSGAARFWFGQGFERIIAARELTLEQLSEVARRSGGDIEAFVHGAVCIAFSGRCLLSLYWAGRDPRRGACAQGCRWRYREIEDTRRPGEANLVEQDERGTYFFDAKDLCGLPVLEPMLATGVRSLKIEGRTRSVHYVGTTVDVYRHATELIARGDLAEFERRRPDYLAELARASHRGFSTHFYGGGDPGPEAYNPQGSYANSRYDFLGRVVNRTEDFVDVALRNPLIPGAAFEIRDRGLQCETGTVQTLRTVDAETLERARSGDVVRLSGKFQARPGALVRAPATPQSQDADQDQD